jgi:OmcA/MtrC family decaheme c-type cytochrome
MEFQKVGTPNVDAVTNAYFDFVPDGSPVATTRNVVTMNSCSTCHAGVKLHKGYATEYCVTCHNQNTFDPYTGETVDLQRFLHKLHRGQDLPSVLAGGTFKVNNIDFGAGTYPGNITDCGFACHKETATKPGSTTLLENAADWYKKPTKRACEACHDGTDALAHINGQVTAAQECTTCHGSTTTFGLDVKSVHNR